MEKSPGAQKITQKIKIDQYAFDVNDDFKNIYSFQ